MPQTPTSSNPTTVRTIRVLRLREPIRPAKPEMMLEPMRLPVYAS
jgi:hypothetical protein